MMSLKDQINEDMKSAMRAKEVERLGTIRLLLAALKQKEVDERVELTDAMVLAIIEKLIKQRKDSITQFQAANRQDLVDKEQAELLVLQAYMPEQLSESEVAAVIAKIVQDVGATGPQDMGKVMGTAKSQLSGKADMGMVSSQVKAALSK